MKGTEPHEIEAEKYAMGDALYSLWKYILRINKCPPRALYIAAPFLKIYAVNILYTRIYWANHFDPSFALD